MIPDTDRKRIIERRILRELRAYALQHADGMQMQVLACKYAKALSGLGGFPELLTELETQGVVRVEHSTNGARKVHVVAEGHGNTHIVVKKVWF